MSDTGAENAPHPNNTSAEKTAGLGLTVFLISLVTIGGFIWLLLKYPNLLSGSPENTRVFIALTFGAGIFIIAFMCLAIVAWLPGDTDKKFNGAKGIFTALLPIFGTIIGFYFGSSQVNLDSPPAMETRALSELESVMIEKLKALDISAPNIPPDQLGQLLLADLNAGDDTEKERLFREILGLGNGAPPPANGAAGEEGGSGSSGQESPN